MGSTKYIGTNICVFLLVGLVHAGIERPVGHWAFDEGAGATAIDTGTGGTNGTVAGATWVNDPELGWCLSFDGDGDYVDIGAFVTELGGIADFTVSLRVKTSDSYQQGLLAQAWWADGKYTANESLLYISDGTWASYGDVAGAPSFASYGGIWASSNIVVNDGQWHQIVFANKGHATAAELKMFVDGVESTNVLSTNGKANYSGDTIRIGTGEQNFVGFEGLIDDVYIYDRVLSPADVAQLYSREGLSAVQPADGAGDVPISTILQWDYDIGSIGATCDVYFGRDPNVINNPKVLSNSGETLYDPILEYGKWYYWRVDVMGGLRMLKGLTRKFKTEKVCVSAMRIGLCHLALLAEMWLSPGCSFQDGCGSADLTGDGQVDFKDFAALGKNWLEAWPLPEAWWKFDEKEGTIAADSSFNNHNGVVFGCEWMMDGHKEGAIKFDGIDDYISVKELGTFNTLSISMWLNVQALSHSYNSLYHEDGWESGGVALLLENNGSVQFSVKGCVPDSINSGFRFHSGLWNQWHHLAVVYDSITQKVAFYFDGIKGSEQTLTTARPAVLASGQIGGWNLGNMNFQGQLDDVRMYDSALTGDQIAVLADRSWEYEFGVYYDKLNFGESWEEAFRSGAYSDVVVRFGDRPDKMVFWRGTSYLPYWETAQGRWYFEEVVPRSGDGTGLMPDRFCRYSHVRVIEQSDARQIVHWRYAPDFNSIGYDGRDGYFTMYPGYDSWVDEYFTIYPDRICVRTIRKGHPELTIWNDPNHTTLKGYVLEASNILPLPEQWQQMSDLSLTGAATGNYRYEGYDSSRRSYVLSCLKKGATQPLNCTLTANPSGSIYNPVLEVHNWGDADVNILCDGQALTDPDLFKTGYINSLESKDLVVWLKKQSDTSMSIILTPSGGSTPINGAPQVNAGKDKSIVVPGGTAWPYEVMLAGEVKDDGLPNDSLTLVWSQVSGPSATIDNPAKANSVIRLTTTGEYTFKLTANDGQYSKEDSVLVRLSEPSTPSISPVGWWDFNEGSGTTARERVGQNDSVVSGNYTVWEAGVSGASLTFDGYTSGVTHPKARAPVLDEAFTIEAWIAPQTYSWNWTAIVNQEQNRKTGYFFGIDYRGYLGLHLNVGNAWYECHSSQPIPLLKWTHIAGTFDKTNGRVVVYVNGVPTGTIAVASSNLVRADVDLLIGKNCTRMYPRLTERGPSKVPSDMVFDGRIDEVKIYNQALNQSQINELFSATEPVEKTALQFRKMPANTPFAGRFRASYARLEYSPQWDNLWRVGDHPDVIVTFEESPVRMVFWRGTSFCPAWVTENDIWVSDQGPESLVGECFEMMSDKQLRYSHDRILENTDARVVVHWRTALPSVRYSFNNINPNTGWPEWADEYYYIYPDAVAVRYQEVWSDGHIIELQQGEVLHQPGRTPEDDIYLNPAVTAVNLDGQTEQWSWETPGGALAEGSSQINGDVIELINLKAANKRFVIGEIGTRWDVFDWKSPYSKFTWWNHWPVAQLPNDGHVAATSDRPSCSCLGTLREVRHQAGNAFLVAMNLYGMTGKGKDAVVQLARSWNLPPALQIVSAGFMGYGYDKKQRAYVILCLSPDADQLDLSLEGSTDQPIVNPCLVIKNWGHEKVAVTIDGQAANQGSDFHIGHVGQADGTVNLVVWFKKTSVTPVAMRLQRVD